MKKLAGIVLGTALLAAAAGAARKYSVPTKVRNRVRQVRKG